MKYTFSLLSCFKQRKCYKLLYKSVKIMLVILMQKYKINTVHLRGITCAKQEQTKYICLFFPFIMKQRMKKYLGLLYTTC